MADEEVDWGMDEQEDEWRGGGLDDSARIDDDVISLEGGDDDAQASSTRQPATGLGSKNPPTGPKKGRKGEVPGGPRQGADSQTSRINAQSAAADSEKPSNGGASPLPPGWTAVMSKSHNRPFYFHKESNQTAWDKPAFPAELAPEPQAEPVESGAEVEAATAVPVEQKEIKERLVPTGPSASRNVAAQPRSTHAPVPATTPANQDAGNQNVANAYARRQTQPPAPQGPGFGPGPGGRNARARSPLRGDRDGDAKRFKQDNGGRRSPPPHQSLIRDDSRRPRPSLTQSNSSLPPNARAPGIPTGPGGPATPAGSRYDRERDQDRERDRSGYDRPPHGGDRPMPESGRRIDRPRGPHPHVQGANSAPIANNRWGNNNAGAVAADGNANLGSRRTGPEQEAEFASQPVLTTTLNVLKPDLIPAASATAASLLPTSGAPASGVETTEAKRARLREEARTAKLLLDRIALEEANLEQEERRAQEERRREQEAQKLRKIEEDRRREEQERRREEELRLRQEREPEERHRLEYERDMRERERSAPFPHPGLRDARPDFRGERPDRGFLPPQDSAFAREPLPPQGALSRDGRREGWDRRRASDGFGHGPGPAGDYPPPPLGERERVPMRDRLGGGPRDRVPFDQQQAPGPFGRRPLSPPPGHPSYDRRRSPPLGNYGPRGPPGPMRGGPLDHPMPPHMRGDVRDRDMRDVRDRDFRGRDVRGGREPFFPPGPPGRGPESRGEPGFAGPPPRDLLRRLGKRVDHQLAEPMGGNLQRDDRRDVTPRRGPQQNNNAQTPRSRPLAERMSAVGSPSTPPLPPTADASDPSLPVGSNEVPSAGDVIPEQQGKGQGQGQDKQERRRGGRKKRGGQGGRRDRGGGGGGGRNTGNGQGGANGGGGGGGEASEEKRGEHTVDPEGR